MFNVLTKIVRNQIIIVMYILRIIFGFHNNGKRIICFHEISNGGQFEEKIKWLRENYEILSLGELLQKPIGEKSQLTLTFDDGYVDWYETAAPILRKYNVPAVFFICSKFIGSERFPLRKQSLRMLNKDQLISLSQERLFEIGCHTASHIDLGGDWQLDILQREITEEKKLLESWLNQSVRWFAYPFGLSKNISKDALDLVKAAGFEAAFTIIPSFFEGGKVNQFLIGRDSLNYKDSKLLWMAWLSGSYDKLSKWKS